MSTGDLVERTHREGPWKLTEMNERIPMTLSRFLDELT
jgi:hypothetical protein